MLLYLMRHGEVAYNRQNAYIGSTDLPLTDTGGEQAMRLAEYLNGRDVSVVYSSTLSRARQTAEIVADRLGITVEPCDDLREIDYGLWEGVPEIEVAEEYAGLHQQWRANPLGVRIPGGETFAELRDRVLPAFNSIVEAHPEANVAVVAHKSANRLLLAYILGMDLNRYRQIGQLNACVNIIERRDDGRLVVEKINDVCHIRGSGDSPDHL